MICFIGCLAFVFDEQLETTSVLLYLLIIPTTFKISEHAVAARQVLFQYRISAFSGIFGPFD